ncbi:hypothetical protein LZ30DRAFT_701700 [Colletotrichum cereale]|nr:hypothetical protein LZ30DRAFT_701700 [Colletotrichum cereale]
MQDCRTVPCIGCSVFPTPSLHAHPPRWTPSLFSVFRLYTSNPPICDTLCRLLLHLNPAGDTGHQLPSTYTTAHLISRACATNRSGFESRNPIAVRRLSNVASSDTPGLFRGTIDCLQQSRPAMAMQRGVISRGGRRYVSCEKAAMLCKPSR